MSSSTPERLAAIRKCVGEVSGRDSEIWPRFVEIALDQMLADELSAREPGDVTEALGSLFDRLIQPRLGAEIAADVHDTRPAGSSCDTALVTATDDMAFFVDTVSMAVRETGADIDWVLNVLVRVTRDDDGHVVELAAPSDTLDGARDELLMRFEFAAPASLDVDALTTDVERRLDDLAVVVGDWAMMKQAMTDVAADLETPPANVDAENCIETAAFLRWLVDDHFTLLGYRQRELRQNADGENAMVDVPNASFGLLREDRPGLDDNGYVASPALMDRYTGSKRTLVVSKANTRSWIHHNDVMDVIAVKRINADGETIGAHRFLGLFSNEAYSVSPREIPTLRHKVNYVAEQAGIRQGSNRAKNFNYILETFPRDELFQSGEDELLGTIMGVLGMRETEKLRLFVRRDRYDRFFSCLVFVPRERYDRNLRLRIAGELARSLSGSVQHVDTRFLRGAFMRIYMLISAGEAIEAEIDTEALESRLLAVTRDWSDRFIALCRRDNVGLRNYARAFEAAYRERYDAGAALIDAGQLAELGADDQPRLRVVDLDDAGDVRLKLYGTGTQMALADVMPIFEEFGLSAHTQWPFVVEPSGQTAQWIHEYEAEHANAEALTDPTCAESVCQAFGDVLAGRAENDGLNRLIIAAELTPRQVVLVRTIVRYLLQTELPFSPVYVQNQIVAHAGLVQRLVRLFESRFDPDAGGADAGHDASEIEAIESELESVTTLDADRVLRAFYAVVNGCLRTNFYQRDADGQPKPYVSIKLDPRNIPELPRPVPAFEAFVYAPAVEGVHLRGGKVARGGIRWSDRREDFRTEVLGLMKAQMVKNAVIVPVGAKGGFVVKARPAEDSREARQNLGIECYKTFIRGLLDVTDNRDGDAIAKPERVVCYDEADPYLVVAADKGTASFSDIANGVSQEYGFWLDDAFASGGETGYDHKVMAITARGAWESVRQHFRALGRDPHAETFSAVGVGDMAGDVFGNGMLRSDQMQLVAAFNHRHIFIDPNPDPVASYAERKRLFEDPSLAWSDYDESRISSGGGVFKRSAKYIELSDAARHVLGVQSRRMTPNAVIGAILRAPVDLLWNGGIGTYVKASFEANASVGDRANDGVRVDGCDLRCSTVGEGGNLGLTQNGRVEAALAGVALNTDAIDNSGGVDSSDLEVNIKIALGTVEASGEISREARNDLLAEMSDGVATRVLTTNYRQNLQLGLLQSDTVARFDEQVSFMRALERDGWLDRQLENLPGDDALVERARDRVGLVRPELSVLFAYSKIALADALLASNIPDDPWLEGLLDHGFPDDLVKRFPQAVHNHRLKRELISTRVTNRMIDRMGIASAHRLPTGMINHMAAAAEAYLLADAWLDGETLFARVEALDGQVAVETQYELHRIVIRLLKHAMNWWMGMTHDTSDLGTLAGRYSADAQRLLDELPNVVTGDYERRWQAYRDKWIDAGVNDETAASIASANSGGGIMDVVSMAGAFERDVFDVARIYFAVGDELGIAWLQDAIHTVAADDRWQALARASLRNDSYRVHQQIVAQVLQIDADEPLTAWREENAETVTFIQARMSELHDVARPDHAHLNVVVRDLVRLTTLKPQSVVSQD
ncbi:NAD-glutamate dehydrogenase [Salinisphaera orenii]|uniref:NAD-glutamate dehydrogenase n=1 Tax=Salinisphaera orenii TaxID=856731 RepID=UPI000DBE9677